MSFSDFGNDGRSRIAGYLKAAGLAQAEGHQREIALAIADLLDCMGEKITIDDLSSLYLYSVPMLDENGMASAELAPIPYDLAGILGGRSEQVTRRLSLLEQLIERVRETTGVDWLGIYQRREFSGGRPVLVKLAYLGCPSRAELSLLASGVESRASTTVGTTGRALIIDDLNQHPAGARDFSAQARELLAEACVPILNGAGDVIGVVDAFSVNARFFVLRRLAILAALSIVASELLP